MKTINEVLDSVTEDIKDNLGPCCYIVLIAKEDRLSVCSNIDQDRIEPFLLKVANFIAKKKSN